jgi:hypothetical protein
MSPVRSAAMPFFGSHRLTLTPIADTTRYVATHGSVWDYDRRVPILFWRPGIAGTTVEHSAETTDILPTLAAMIGLSVEPGSIDGHCLKDVPGALRRGAVLVDIRPHAQRDREGHVAAALVVERNVLEWRCDPTSDAKLPQAVDDDVGLRGLTDGERLRSRSRDGDDLAVQLHQLRIRNLRVRPQPEPVRRPVVRRQIQAEVGGATLS